LTISIVTATTLGSARQHWPQDSAAPSGYVHRLFATTGRSVGEHLNEKRIAACTCKLLDRNSAHKTIAEIAFAAGFRDISHFNRLFKRCNGLPPREFRRTMAPC
jgi:AraC family transcriptional regulator, positive regulator of tynA and feaB